MMTITKKRLPERFDVIEELGRGGSSVVYRALDTASQREVAVKLLLKSSEEDRFRREARQLASLSHPNVVSFLEVGSHEGHDFLVMEYLEMGELNAYVRTLSVAAILGVFVQICDGLAHLHDRGIVHRDRAEHPPHPSGHDPRYLLLSGSRTDPFLQCRPTG